MILDNIKIIGFDADDTLWVNEPHYREAEEAYATLLNKYRPEDKVSQALFRTEMNNLALYGFGAKSFILSMIENAVHMSNLDVTSREIYKIIEIGKQLLKQPIELLPSVTEVLETLYGKYKLIVATKGDLLDQERKLEKSGLAKYFYRMEVMSDKKPENYQKLLNHLDCKPEEFLMVGNSMKSDVLPPLELGSKAIHVPYHTTWEHETTTISPDVSDNFKIIKTLSDILNLR